MIGRRIRRFEIVAPLGRGGMATVWEAHDSLLGRPVALKLLDAGLAENPKSRRRFHNEATIAASLDHPAIAPVYEAGEQDDLVFLVMKRIEGTTLADRQRERLLPVDEALRIAAAVAGALAYAHGRSVVHRDISPRNIMIGHDGRVYVLDFGLARVPGPHDTTSGTIVGTPAYIAPEILLGAEADARSDLYSLGVVLHEALTGSTPFAGVRVEVQAYEALHTAVAPPSRMRPEIGAGLDALVLRLLDRDPAKRFTSAADLVTALKGQREPGAADGAAPREGPGAGTTGGAGTGDARPEHGGIASRWAAGRAQAYVAVTPIEATESTPDDRRIVSLLEQLASAARAGLARADRVHVLASDAKARPGEDTRMFARRVGANLVLHAAARTTGEVVRVTFSFVDPEAGVIVAGGTVEGSRLAPFELEDRYLAALTRALAPGHAAEAAPGSRPRDPAADERFAQALSYLQRFDNEASLDGAIARLEGLITSEGESAIVLAALARACLHRYRLTSERTWESRAVQACDRARELEPDAPDVLLALGELHVAAGRHVEGLDALERALVGRPDLYEAQLARATALDGLGRTAEAEACCRRAIEARPDDWRGHHTLGLVLFRRGRYAEAAAPWQRVVELVPDHAGGHRNLGSALANLDQHDAALEAYRRSIAIRPNAMALANTGALLYYMGRHREAVEALERAVALNPSNARAWGNLGNACHHVAGLEVRAREALEHAVALVRERLDRAPGTGEDWSLLAGWLANLGHVEDARRATSRALAMSPDDVHCMVESAEVLLQLGERAESLTWLRRAVESGYGVELLRRSLELRVLEGDPEYERILEQGSRRVRVHGPKG
jgi:tetratricopeptide (TPR) repeat protein/predicted Ser/Thr protein kinase